MNKEIEEYLEKYKNKFEEYDNIMVSVNDLREITDYTINIQKENERLQAQLNGCDELLENDMKTIDDYKSRIDKTIEYIEKHTNHFVLGGNKEVDEFDYISTSPKALLNILKGE